MATTAGMPFSMDTANHLAQTQGFMGLVDETRGNNQRLLAAADTFQTVNQGHMAASAQMVLADVHSTAVQNNEVLNGITTGLQTSYQMTDGQEATNAASVMHAGAALGTSIYT
ncbi:hypothetical protein MSIMFB_03178 [Mycobacterium simulans]|uniref:Uncharacterized protein n=1 Tax=Mycobacterium simulans TaxID=627089 RepID=A0A7Z7ILA6_9MYCO|nr:hypothetical protein [Mycobacterium simulans]SOJ55697.1 hypothetical protein MSIMFB_03178 [Mycobacterium simulans]SON61871.1 hypothetical protein MSIMFI_03390 [Mycobacterium simulans]